MRVSLLVLALTLTACGQASEPPGRDTAAAGSAGWTRLPDAPLSGRIGAAMAAVGDEVVVVGGWQFLCPPTADCSFLGERLLADGAAVDLATGEWRPIADAPYGLRHPVTAVVGDMAYFLTGCRGGAGCNGRQELLAYDVDADRWTELATLPRGAGASALVPVDGGLFASAGSEENGERSDHLYDSASDTWREVPDDPLPVTFDRWPVADRGRVLVLGSQVAGLDDEVDDGLQDRKVVAALDLATLTWTRLPDAPGGGYQAWDVGDEIWLNAHFGQGGGGVLDLTTDTWGPPPAPPEDDAWRGDAAGVIGAAGATYEYADGWVRDTRADRWLEVPRRADNEFEQGVTAAGDALVVFGGSRWPSQTSLAGGELLAETWVWRPPEA